MTELVGLSGYARTGKDTVALVLMRAGYKRVAFADAIRDALLEVDPLVFLDCHADPHRLSAVVAEHGWDRAKAHSEVRRLLQSFGVAMRRQAPGIWVQVAMAKAQRIIAAGGRVVVTDVRFPDEADAIRNAHPFTAPSPGVVWRVNRHGYGPINGHVSETALDRYPFDWHIWNNGSLDELGVQVLRAVG